MFDESAETDQLSPKDGKAIGWEIESLLNQPGVRERFREMLLLWWKKSCQHCTDLEKWQRRRHEHFTKTVINSSILQNENGGHPPKGYEDWEFDRYVPCQDENGNQCERLPINGWCPPDLLPEAKPCYRLISFCQCWGRDHESSRKLGIEEKYMLFATFHGIFCTGVEPISSWDDDFIVEVSYAAVCHSVERLHHGDLPAIRQFLNDVKKDIESHCPSVDGKGGSSKAVAMKNYELEMGLDIKAVGVLTKHPHWTNKQIAEAIGCHPKSLSRLQGFTDARKIQKQGRYDLPRGTKDADGNMESWDNREFEDDC
ncbi:MAG: hypothetical protein FWC56_02745 [Phycisphaerae bacterium]|nr:hypothetical protein [Phycisphaerae bacterium]